MTDKRLISERTLDRLPMYYNYLKVTAAGNAGHISAAAIARGLGLNDVQVRKDLAAISGGGRPRVGYETKGLMKDIESCLNYGAAESAVLVGAGNLGRALAGYEGFVRYGVDIAAVFDSNDDRVGSSICGKRILPVRELAAVCKKKDIRLGIIAVPDSAAQDVCDSMVKCGITAVWSFASVRLCVPKGVAVRYEDMGLSLHLLSRTIKRQIV